ncbi:MAG: ParB/RepB/Spo0J family partition protein [Clostridia bacterium]|nr:ParB/RepB/Spo0J family partition protein [Clostridia bacterium]
MAKKQSLGKGLDLIFDDNTIESNSGMTYVPVSSVSPKAGQPRKYFSMESLSELASSIAAHGVLQPIIVRDLKNGTYEIVAGERRWRASKLAGLSEIPCIIMDADEIMSAQIALVENVQREDLNPYEEALAYKTLIDDFGLSQEEVSNMVGKSRPAITNSMRLLDLPKEVLDMLVVGTLSAGHCRALLALKDKSDVVSLASKVSKRGMSVRETEAAVKKLNRDSERQYEDDPAEKRLVVNYRADLERRVTSLSGRRIKISDARGRRVVKVEYTDDEDLENLLSLICGKSVIEE